MACERDRKVAGGVQERERCGRKEEKAMEGRERGDESVGARKWESRKGLWSALVAGERQINHELQKILHKRDYDEESVKIS